MQFQQPYDEHVSPRPANASPSAVAAAAGYPGAQAVPVSGAPMAAPQQQPPFAQPAPQLPQPLPPVPVQQIMLPPGAQLYNGGVLYHTNVFANSYAVPGPGGRDQVFYDNSMPLPPQPHDPPSLSEQWNGMTKLIKLFIVLLGVFWALHWLVSWTVALFMPILLIPTYILWRKWRSHHESVELLMIAKLYATAFVPGAIIVMIVESIVTVIFIVICFQSYIAQLMNSASDKPATPTPSPSPDPSNPDGEAPYGMDFLNLPISPALIIFLILLSYGTAGCTEESLKYYLTNSVKKHRPSYKVVYGYLLYAVASALGFSTMENIGYVLTGALGPGGDNSALGVFLNTCGRAFIATPLHVLTGYLIGLQVVRRDVFGERLSLFRVMGWSVFFHGSFDFGLFLIMVLQKQWSGDNAVSYTLMACVVINCYAGLAYKIWRGRQKVFNRVEFPEVAEEAGGAAAGGAAAAVGSGSIQAPAGANGFSRLPDSQAEVDSAV